MDLARQDRASQTPVSYNFFAARFPVNSLAAATPRSDVINKSSSSSSVASSSFFSVNRDDIPLTILLDDLDNPLFNLLNQLFVLLSGSNFKIAFRSYRVAPSLLLMLLLHQ